MLARTNYSFEKRKKELAKQKKKDEKRQRKLDKASAKRGETTEEVSGKEQDGE